MAQNGTEKEARDGLGGLRCQAGVRSIEIFSVWALNLQCSRCGVLAQVRHTFVAQNRRVALFCRQRYALSPLQTSHC